MRLLKSTLQATFPNITGAVTPTHTQLNNVFFKLLYLIFLNTWFKITSVFIYKV